MNEKRIAKFIISFLETEQLPMGVDKERLMYCIVEDPVQNVWILSVKDDVLADRLIIVSTQSCPQSVEMNVEYTPGDDEYDLLQGFKILDLSQCPDESYYEESVAHRIAMILTDENPEIGSFSVSEEDGLIIIESDIMKFTVVTKESKFYNISEYAYDDAAGVTCKITVDSKDYYYFTEEVA
jgi:hypothetical protein